MMRLFGRKKNHTDKEEEVEEAEEGKEGETGEGSEEEAPGKIDVFQISDSMRGKIKKVRESDLDPSLLPKLDEGRDRLEKDIYEKQEETARIEDLIPKLKEKKRVLQEDVKRGQEELSRIEEIKQILQRI